ncbi:TIGR02391 family protein [Eleftheria terrae]|uniref:TIGR02391 family protein n=1 Tax=Eleftheria terrae TaxID=1597781 RepID=UPI00263B6213|nr:TIGR02391 family protein [Eleftheria terrae]WKB50901.1 TIGR02391 family protein [Eleftheria terrae]
MDAQAHLEIDEKEAAKKINGYLKADYEALLRLWRQADPDLGNSGRVGALGRHIHFGMAGDYDDILGSDLPDILVAAERVARMGANVMKPVGFEELLHPAIVESSLPQYKADFLRESVLNGVMAVMEMLRARTGLKLDGKDLVGQAFGLKNGILILSDLDSESGQNDQKGFLMIYEGVYTGVRNVKAHSLTHDLNAVKAAQYLVMLSLLARRIDEAKVRPNENGS